MKKRQPPITKGTPMHSKKFRTLVESCCNILIHVVVNSWCVTSAEDYKYMTDALAEIYTNIWSIQNPGKADDNAYSRIWKTSRERTAGANALEAINVLTAVAMNRELSAAHVLAIQTDLEQIEVALHIVSDEIDRRLLAIEQGGTRHSQRVVLVE